MRSVTAHSVPTPMVYDVLLNVGMASVRLGPTSLGKSILAECRRMRQCTELEIRQLPIYGRVQTTNRAPSASRIDIRRTRSV